MNLEVDEFWRHKGSKYSVSYPGCDKLCTWYRG